MHDGAGIQSLQAEMKSSTAVLLFFCVSSIGCASVTGTSVQPISVTAVCGGSKVLRDATCIAMNDKGQWFVTSPGSIMIQKSFGDLSVSCRQGESYGSLIVKSSSNSNVWGNVLAGGLIGYAVDAGSGAGFNYPNMISVPMDSSCQVK
jgi:hypothetical protein